MILLAQAKQGNPEALDAGRGLRVRGNGRRRNPPLRRRVLAWARVASKLPPMAVIMPAASSVPDFGIGSACGGSASGRIVARRSGRVGGVDDPSSDA